MEEEEVTPRWSLRLSGQGAARGSLSAFQPQSPLQTLSGQRGCSSSFSVAPKTFLNFLISFSF